MNKTTSLFVLIFSLCLVGCSDDIPYLNKDDSYNQTFSKYVEYTKKSKERINEMWSLISPLQSRTSIDSMSGNELFWYLVSLPENKLDSLRNIYCTPENLNAQEEIYELNLQTLIELSSPEDVQNLYTFIDNYVDLGGHDIQYIETELKSRFDSSPEIIKDCVIDDAAWIDENIPEQPSDPNSINAHQECIKHIIKELTKSKELDAALLVATDLGSLYDPLLGFVIGAGTITYSLISELELAHEYHKCMIGRSY